MPWPTPQPPPLATGGKSAPRSALAAFGVARRPQQAARVAGGGGTPGQLPSIGIGGRGPHPGSLVLLHLRQAGEAVDQGGVRAQVPPAGVAVSVLARGKPWLMKPRHVAAGEAGSTGACRAEWAEAPPLAGRAFPTGNLDTHSGPAPSMHGEVTGGRRGIASHHMRTRSTRSTSLHPPSRLSLCPYRGGSIHWQGRILFSSHDGKHNTRVELYLIGCLHIAAPVIGSNSVGQRPLPPVGGRH